MLVFFTSEEKLPSIILDDSAQMVQDFVALLAGGATISSLINGQAYNGCFDLRKIVAVVNGQIPQNGNRLLRVQFTGKDGFDEFPLFSQDFPQGTDTPDIAFQKFLAGNGQRGYSYTRGQYHVVVDFEQVIYAVYRQ